MTESASPTPSIPAQNIILAGFMGSGKTTVGRLLARRLGWDFIDCDEEIERRAGMRISEIFAQEGESAFRDLETGLADELADKRHCVISTGGGFMIRRENRDAARQAGSVVYLETTPEEAFARVRGTGHRPLLDCEDPLLRIRELLETRRPTYESLPIRVRTTGLTPDEVTGLILEKLSRQ